MDAHKIVLGAATNGHQKNKQTNPFRREGKIREKINKIEIQKTIEKKINKTKSWFFENVNKIDKPLARLILGSQKNRVEVTARPHTSIL